MTRFESDPPTSNRDFPLHVNSTAHVYLMNQDVWIDIITEIDNAMEQESSRLIVLAGRDGGGKTALCTCWKKQHILKYAEIRDGEKLDMVICFLNFSLRLP